MNWGDDRLRPSFWAKVAPCPMSGCWLWTGAGGGYQRQYGKVGINSRIVYTHRVAYEAANGPIAAGLQIDHRCRTPMCCNPAHLDAVTPAENNRRSESLSAKCGRRTACIRGHAFTEDNTRIAPTPTGGRGRWCRECDRLEHLARRRAEGRPVIPSMARRPRRKEQQP